MPVVTTDDTAQETANRYVRTGTQLQMILTLNPAQALRLKRGDELCLPDMTLRGADHIKFLGIKNGLVKYHVTYHLLEAE